jgi:hypothetical protein
VSRHGADIGPLDVLDDDTVVNHANDDGPVAGCAVRGAPAGTRGPKIGEPLLIVQRPCGIVPVTTLGSLNAYRFGAHLPEAPPP